MSLLKLLFLGLASALIENPTFNGVVKDRFKNKVCLVTGSTSGLGEHAAYHLAMEGCKVVVTGRRTEKGEAVVKKIRETFKGDAVFMPLDVTKPEMVKGVMNDIGEMFGRLDAVFANAGTSTHVDVGSGWDTIEDWNFIIDVNLNGVWNTLKYGSELMFKSDDPKGTFVLCSSILGLRASGGIAPYTASKHALEGLKKDAAQTFGPAIRVNNVNPSFTNSEMVDPFLDFPSIKEWILESQPGGRMSEQAEVSGVVAWLLSDHSAYVNGVSIPVDGGLTTGWIPRARTRKIWADFHKQVFGEDFVEHTDKLDFTPNYSPFCDDSSCCTASE